MFCISFIRLFLVVCITLQVCEFSLKVEGALSPARGRLPTPSSFPLANSLKDFQRNVKDSIDETWSDLPLYRDRFPSALKDAIVAGSSSFLSSLMVLFPVALVLSIRPSYPNWKAVLKNGFVTGLQWSAFSGIFVVSLCEVDNCLSLHHV